MAILKNKYVVIIGDRNGVPGPAVGECVRTTGAKIVYSLTRCFVWTSTGAVNLRNQKRVLNISEEHGPESIVVLLGAAEAEAADLAAKTVTAGDPAYAGPLAGVQSELSVYYICEDEMEAETNPAVYEEQVGTMEMIIDVPAVHEGMEDIRKGYCRY